MTQDARPPQPTSATQQDAVPFVTTTLRVAWLPAILATAAGDAVRLATGPIWPVIRDRYRANGNGSDDVGTAAYYRVTPAVYTWVVARLADVEQRWLAGNDPDLGEQLHAAAARWRPVAEWAELAFPAEILAAAAATPGPALPEAPPRWTDTDRTILRTLAGGGWQNDWKVKTECLGKRG